MSAMPLPVIETSGSPYEMGFQHGQQAADQIRATHRRYCPAEVGSAESRASLWPVVEATVARLQPQALEEMRGIADGAGMTYAQIQELNFSIELWSDTFLLPPSARGCTLVGLKAATNGWLVGKTMDVSPGDEAFVLAQRASPAEGCRYVHVTYAGTLWTDGGVNERGLAQVNSSLMTRAQNLGGFPVFLMARNLLQGCGTVAEAVTAASESDGINFGTNLLLADAGGDCAVVERSVTRHGVRRPQAGDRRLFATNHSLAADLDAVLGGSPALLANSRERFERLAALSAAAEASLEALQGLFRDHARPGGFCQHGQADLHTIGAFIAGTRTRQLWVSLGPPCENPFESVLLDRPPLILEQESNGLNSE